MILREKNLRNGVTSLNKKDEEIRETYIEDTDDQEQVNNDEEQAWEEEQRKYNLILLQDLLKEY